jgi:hypothetical protein
MYQLPPGCCQQTLNINSQLLHAFSTVLVKNTPLPQKKSSDIISGDLGNHDPYEISHSPRTLKIGMLEYKNNSVGCLREKLDPYLEKDCRIQLFENKTFRKIFGPKMSKLIYLTF